MKNQCDGKSTEWFGALNYNANITVMMYYIMVFLSENEGLEKMSGGSQVQMILNLGSYVIAIFAAIFLFYTHSFMIKRRKKEFGLFNILGMEKKHISRVLVFETMYVAVISMGAGLLGGILLSKLIFIVLLYSRFYTYF